jgi:hypothetical protein
MSFFFKNQHNPNTHKAQQTAPDQEHAFSSKTNKIQTLLDLCISSLRSLGASSRLLGQQVLQGLCKHENGTCAGRGVVAALVSTFD